MYSYLFTEGKTLKKGNVKVVLYADNCPNGGWPRFVCNGKSLSYEQIKNMTLM